MANVKFIERGSAAHDSDTHGKRTRMSPLIEHPTRRVDPLCVSLVAPRSYESGRYQQLRSTLERGRPGPRGVVAVTSPAAGDGKTVTAINLAGAFAQNPELKVLLVDVDLRRGSEVLREYFGLPTNIRPGLTDILTKPESVVDPILHTRDYPNLSILPRGRLSTNPYELLASRQFGEFIRRARESYHYVILDTPPVMPVPDNTVIADWVDGFVMVVTANRTPRDVVAESLRAIGQDKMIGLVLNQCDPLPERYYQYYGVYGNEKSGSPQGDRHRFANGHRRSPGVSRKESKRT